MNPWAVRIDQRLRELPGKTAAGLARACGIQQPSVTGWMNGSTHMIRGDNLVFAAAYLETTPAWIITGKGSHNGQPLEVREPSPHYNALPDVATLGAAIDAAQRAFAKANQIPNAMALAAGTILALRQAAAGEGKAAIVAAVAKRLKELGGDFSRGETLERIRIR